MLAQRLTSMTVTLLDLETTGLNPAHGHRVCEVALLRMRGNTAELRYESLVNPQRPLDAQAAAVNGLSTAMLHNAPTFATIADTVQDIIGTSVLVAHNAPFDLAFLNHEWARLGWPRLSNTVLDTLPLTRRLLPLPSYSLPALAHALGLVKPGHRAMQDVLTLAQLFQALCVELAERGVVTLEDVLRFERGLLPGQPEPEAPPLVVQALHEQRCLRIRYRSRSTPTAVDRTIQPMALVQERHRVLLRAFCHLRNDMRVFALDKIETMELV